MAKAIYCPIVIEAGVNDAFRISINGGGSYTTITATAGTYGTMPDLCLALAVAMDAAFPAQQFRFYIVRGSYGIASMRFARTVGSGSALRLHFPSAGSGGIGPTLGFLNSTVYTPSGGPPEYVDSPNIPPGVLIKDGFIEDSPRVSESKPPGGVGINGDVGLYHAGAAWGRALQVSDLYITEWIVLRDMVRSILGNVLPTAGTAGDLWGMYIDDDWVERMITPSAWYRALRKYRMVDSTVSFARAYEAPHPQRGRTPLTLVEVT